MMFIQSFSANLKMTLVEAKKKFFTVFHSFLGFIGQVLDATFFLRKTIYTLI